MVIRQGDIYWLELGEPFGSEPGYRRPYVVVQNDVLNASRIGTVIVCTIYSTLAMARSAGNVVLDQGEGGLPKRSVVNVSQLFTVDKARLEQWQGTLSKRRVRQILTGISRILEPRSLEED
jgi:mRNA interferase MazF